MAGPIVEHPVLNYECWFRVSLLKFLFLLGINFIGYLEWGLVSASAQIDMSRNCFMGVFVKTWRKSSIAGCSVSFLLSILIWLLRESNRALFGLDEVLHICWIEGVSHVFIVNVETWVFLDIRFAWMTVASMGSHVLIPGPIFENSWNWESIIWLRPCFF